MSKFTPTTKSCFEILKLIDGDRFTKKYVQPVYDPYDTHALYGVRVDEVDKFKERIKHIGGKYIRVVSSQWKGFKTISFALEITPQEALKVKMDKEQKERYQQAWDAKLAEIEASIMLQAAGATNAGAKKNFCTYLMNGDLDPLLPFESYVFIDTPTDKDEMRIADIVDKANRGYAGCRGMVTNNRYKMVDLAKQMNRSIKDEGKRMRRKAACLKYGLKFLAKCFEHAA